MQKRLLKDLFRKKEQRQKSLAVLVDPDAIKSEADIVAISRSGAVDYFFVGGSLLTSGDLNATVSLLKSTVAEPVIIFPSNHMHISSSADGILLLSLISGRNPEFLIGNHVLAAPALKESELEILSTGYLIIDSGAATTASYMSNSNPIPWNKPDIAACTALAGSQIGMKLIYLDGGSGAARCVSPEMIRKVSTTVDLPLIVGGGIDSIEKAQAAFAAGADVIVVGNAIERDPSFLIELEGLMLSLNGSKVH